ncbi:MAG: isoleucine--tRNA ligase, partial [Calditrichaeota bacterium]|nr:isoleucine--tRNA ligase [Calditrichota bacterium]
VVTHSYPHCWRCGTPLLYYAKKSWYIRTTEYKDRLIANNRKIRWIPKEVGEGRFGEWLSNNVDWALSRDRFWGTPLNVWKCEKCGHADSVGSVDELLKRSGKESIEDLHKPYIDEITFTCPKCGGTMKREPEVIDVWFDSGSMPYAQWHYPFENQEVFKRNFPADFISEGIDQTRGWFYSLLAISTLLFDQPAYKTVLSIELILDKEGQKMSKSKGNAVDPFKVLERNGADPLRWYLLTVSPPWTPTRFDPDGVLEVQKKFYGTLVNVYAFFVLYANIDQFAYKEARIPEEKRSEIDRWILSAQNRLVAQVADYLERYDVTKAARAISDFVVEDLSNWYVRRSRRRFWKSEMGPDKLSAYQTLYEVLLTVAKLMAPFAPFLPEDIYQNLNSVGKEPYESVHLAEYPSPEAHTFRDEALEAHMDAVRKVVSSVRSIRNEVGIRVRQPLSRILVYTKSKAIREGLPLMADIVRDEVNVKEIEFVDDPARLWVQRAKPNFKSLGPKFGKEVKKVAEIIAHLPEKAVNHLVETGSERILLDGREVEIKKEDVEIFQENRDDFAVAVEDDFTVALDTHLTDALRAEGLAREFVNRVQNMRKEAGFDVTDRIRISFQGNAEMSQAIQKQADYIKRETLATDLFEKSLDGAFTKEWKINGESVVISIERMI